MRSKSHGTLETLLLCGVFVLLVVVRIHALNHAGGLWRDEVNSLEVAKDRSEPAWWDSFPSLWICVVRAWLTVAGDSSDSSCRLLGFLCGMALVVAAWWSTRVRGANGWVSLALLCLHPVVVVYGGELRGYGLGLTFQVLLFGVIARLAGGPSARWHWIALPVVSLLAVQSSYTNTVMLLAASAGAGLVCFIERRWRALAGIGLNGLAAAASMVPYAVYAIPAFEEIATLSRGEYSLWSYVMRFATALGEAGIVGLVWIALPLALLFACTRRLLRQSACGLPQAERRDVIFAVTTLAAGTVGFFAYLRYLSVPTQAWYYLPLLGLWAYCCDLMLGALLRRTGWAGGVRLACVAAFVLVPLSTVWSNTAVRLTNVDLAARAVAERAAPGDLVVVAPWYVGITFARYYEGNAPWTTFPGVVRPLHGYTEFKERMMQARPIDADLGRIEQTLRSGGRIWLVGQLPVLQAGEAPGELPPAPQSPYGWREGAYTTVWLRQAAYTLQRRARSSEVVPVELPWRVQSVELVRVRLIAGWRD